MPRDRLTQLGAEFSLRPESLDRLELLLTLIGAAPQAPTTVTRPELAVDVHVADSLSGLSTDELRRADRIADVGSGAGFPALVLAIARPDAHVTAVESTRRKCDFIQETATALDLDNVAVVCSRAEEWSGGREANAVVCARAVAPLAVICEYAAPLLRLGGALVAWKARIEPEEFAAAADAAAQLGLSPPRLRAVRPYPGSEHRQLAVSVKESPTPERFPRRAGIAAKRPLGTPVRSAG